LSLLLGDKFDLYTLAAAHGEGREWYEVEDKDPGDCESEYQGSEPTVLEETGDHEAETLKRRAARAKLKDRGPTKNEVVAIVPESVVASRARKKRDREIAPKTETGVNSMRIQNVPENEVLCFVFQGEMKVDPCVKTMGYKIERLSSGADQEYEYSVKGLAVLVALRNHYMRIYGTTGCKRARSILKHLSIKYRDTFSLAIQQGWFGEVKFFLADMTAKTAERSSSVPFLDPDDGFDLAKDEELYYSLFGD
jgi:hypothetical protein